MKINGGKESTFAQEFINRYSNRGFGAMNKNDFEILIIDLLRKYGDLQCKSNYDISLILQIPESKVKRLIYEADLRYGNHDEEYIKKKFFELIAKANFKAENQKICFAVENKYIRSAIGAKLKELGHFSDTSFNSEIVSVHLDAFIDLLNAYYPAAAIKRITEACKGIVNKAAAAEEEEKITFKSIMREFVKGATGKAGELAASSIFSVISGGSTSVVQLIDAIKNRLKKD